MATIGILGGGQLARMLAIAGAPLGQRFLVVSRDGVPATNLVWKDTAIIPAGETVDLLVDMANPGRWMIHCHIAEHLGAGMMGVFTVDP